MVDGRKWPQFVRTNPNTLSNKWVPFSKMGPARSEVGLGAWKVVGGSNVLKNHPPVLGYNDYKLVKNFVKIFYVYGAKMKKTFVVSWRTSEELRQYIIDLAAKNNWSLSKTLTVIVEAFKGQEHG